jgi:hypothetical protein
MKPETGNNAIRPAECTIVAGRWRPGARRREDGHRTHACVSVLAGGRDV